jgi:hypothetical protein
MEYVRPSTEESLAIQRQSQDWLHPNRHSPYNHEAKQEASTR